MRIQWIVSATYALFHSCSSAFSRSIKFCVVAPYHYRVRCDFTLASLPYPPFRSQPCVPCARIWAATPPLPRHSRTMTSYLGLLPRTINFVFPLQSRRCRHLRSRHACGIFSKSCHATLDARVTSPRPSPKERGRRERAARKGGSISFVRVLSSKLRTRARRRYIVRGDGDATLQKPWCPPLILLRTPTAKECFCHSTYANEGVKEAERMRGWKDERQEDERMKGWEVWE